MLKEDYAQATHTQCYHCGEDCEAEIIKAEDKSFCCQGCKSVYDILNKVELCNYYNLEKNPGLNQKTRIRPEKFAFLDDALVQQKLINFKDDIHSHATFYLPQMHCSSCIWLLENLGKVNRYIARSQVNFLKKEVKIVFEHKHTGLREMAEMLTSIGYEPHLSLNDLSDKPVSTYDKSRIYKIGITGFCFGNIMLLSFPEYFSLGHIEDIKLQRLFSYLILGLSLPVFFYSASEFFLSAWKSYKQKFLNIDTPIALAILITFVRSVYEILSGTGAGYLDSMTGIVFFMLIGRFFQNYTYNTISFNRDFTSYFPIGVTLLKENGSEEQVPVSAIRAGDRIKVYSQEIIPADCILFMGKATIDYSFVSGESQPVEKGIGEIIYAGGRQLGGALEMEVVKDVSQSYLTQLWNNDTFKKEEHKEESYIHKVSKYFTIVLFAIALITAAYWQLNDPAKMWNAVTSILIVACPCALLLSATFTNGNMLRVLQNFGFFARNALVIEHLAKADTIVFDKTGTLTKQSTFTVNYEGSELNEETISCIRSLVNQSSHPLSKAIAAALPSGKKWPVKQFEEKQGLGISGYIRNDFYRIGSALFVQKTTGFGADGSIVYVQCNDSIIGSFNVKAPYRKGLKPLFNALKSDYKTALLSGDNEQEFTNLKSYFNGELLFHQSPQDKLDYIKRLQKDKFKVIMLGDGLNDAGALKQSDTGIAITDNINNFSPACDVIMKGESLPFLNKLINYCQNNKTIINTSFVMSVLYNIVGLFFAVQGELSPVIAAILMPVSSISIVLLTTGMSSLMAIPLKRAFREKARISNENDINHLAA
ncbi:MAG: heavy metal translocating P-type ATPase metal-binding domain-containing protein [Sediminibacterium sp.]|nr:heavy metal translocating P-type ATPase metal-binding domain-containing protein [Sediminibacterium sp.]